MSPFPAALSDIKGRMRETLSRVRQDAARCRRCPLWQHATQTVFGEGPARAAMMLVGEQPGDQEDLIGRPFVGPAGRVLDEALEAAGIHRADVYVTNAVKHFKNEPRGKRRLHKKPNEAEIDACRWWLDKERALVRPRLTVALGGSAASALLGGKVSIGRMRGRPIPAEPTTLWITVHPSYVLRIPDRPARRAEFARLVNDLAAAGAWLAAHPRIPA